MSDDISFHLPPDPREAPPLRWGILGAGGIARRFAAAVPAGTAGRVVAVGSRSAAKAAAFAHEMGIPRAHGSYEELVADEDVDAVYIATPHSHHHAHALLALNAGKHLLVEKAFTRSAAEAVEVFDLARSTGRFVMEAMWSRFLPHLVALRGLIAEGAVGEVLAVRGHHGQRIGHVERLREPGLAGGALLDLGVYPISFIHSILGAPAAVHATGLLSPEGVDAYESVTLAYERAMGVATSTMWAADRNGGLVLGTEGRVELPAVFFVPNTFTLIRHDSDRPGGVALSYPAPQEGADGFEYQAAEVARCVAAGLQESAVMPWRATIEVMEIMDAVRAQLGVVYPGEA